MDRWSPAIAAAGDQRVPDEIVKTSETEHNIGAKRGEIATHFVHERQIREIQSANRAPPTCLVWKSGFFTASLDSRRFAVTRLIYALVLIASLLSSFGSEAAIELKPSRDIACTNERKECSEYDAIVFVHGIYGSASTFRNDSTRFNWAAEFPEDLNGRKVDTFQLTYDSELTAWARGRNPEFTQLSLKVMESLKALRGRQYRSIGFIAHSLGGNVVTTYLHLVKTRLGHARRAQHAYVVTLATPVLGSTMADLGSSFKQFLGMSDPLLDSLRSNNLYLEMLQVFRIEEGRKSAEFGCRQINLHVAYESRRTGPSLVVEPWSAARPVDQIAASQPQEFQLNHSEIAKPASKDSEVYLWVLTRVTDEFHRLTSWQVRVERKKPSKRLCSDVEYKPEP